MLPGHAQLLAEPSGYITDRIKLFRHRIRYFEAKILLEGHGKFYGIEGHISVAINANHARNNGIA